MDIIRVRKSKGVVFEVIKSAIKTALSKILTVSSKYQITVPEHVRELMGIKASDEVIFMTDGENVFFEKYVPKEGNHLRLVTYARSVLKAGAPVFITGDIARGKSKLAQEIGTYGFEEVIYLSPKKNGDTQALIDKFNYAVSSFGNPQQLLIVDEYIYLKNSAILHLDQSFYENFKGSLVVVSQLEDYLPLPPNYTHSTYYHIHIEDLVRDVKYRLVQHLADDTKPLSNKTFVTDISINLNSPEAITTWGAINHLQKFNETSTQDEFFKGQQGAAISYLEKHLYGTGIFSVNDLKKRLQTISDNVTEDTKALGKYMVGLKVVFEEYLNSGTNGAKIAKAVSIDPKDANIRFYNPLTETGVKIGGTLGTTKNLRE